jgi:hypothetical protein
MNPLKDRIGTGSVLDLVDNPLVAWAWRRAKRDPRTFGLAVVYLLFVHGATGVTFTLTAAPGFGLKFQDLATIVHVLTWGANAFLFLLWVPTRYAQQLGLEREKKTLDFLRLTRVPSAKICFGTFVAAHMVPFYAAITSLPEVLLGCCSENAGYLPGVLQAYAGLVSASLIASALSGVLSFLPKKGIQAASSAFLAVVLLSVAGGFFAVPFFEPLGALGAWGGIFSGFAHGSSRDTFVVNILGTTLPGVLLQVPFALALGLILLDATTRRIEEDRPGFLGIVASRRLALLVAVVCAITYSDTSAVASYWRASDEWGPALAGRMIVMFLVMLPYASDAAVHREDVVRGLARGASGQAIPEETLGPVRALGTIVALAALPTVLLALQVPSQHLVSVVVAGAVLASAVAVAHAVFQATRLYFSQPVRNVMATVALGALWFLPLLGSWGSGLLELPPYVVALPSMLCPFVALTKASLARQPSYLSSSDVDPIGPALVAVLLNVLIACGVFGLLRELVGRLKDFAATLAVLPADVFAPAGQVEKKCPNGHIYRAIWTACPHCPAAPSAKA